MTAKDEKRGRDLFSELFTVLVATSIAVAWFIIVVSVVLKVASCFWE